MAVRSASLTDSLPPRAPRQRPVVPAALLQNVWLQIHLGLHNRLSRRRVAPFEPELPDELNHEGDLGRAEDAAKLDAGMWVMFD